MQEGLRREFLQKMSPTNVGSESLEDEEEKEENESKETYIRRIVKDPDIVKDILYRT